LKILYLTNGFPPNHTAGTETYTAGIAAEFVRLGHEVRVVCGGEWQAGPGPFNGVVTELYRGIVVTRLNLNWTRGSDPNRSLYENPATEEFVQTVLADFKPDVVHLTSCYTLSVSIIRAVKAIGCPLVVTLTDFWFICPRVSLLRSDDTLCNGRTSALTCLKCLMAESNLYHSVFELMPSAMAEPLLTLISHQPFLSRQRGFRGLALDMKHRKTLLPLLLEQADVLIAPSHFLAEMYRANGLTAPIRVVPYGHNLDWVKNIKRRTDSDKLIFGFVGRLTHAKGVHLFIEALTLLGNNLPVEGYIWGDTGQEPDYYSQLLQRVAPSTPVKFCGKFKHSQIAEVYGGIDVLVVSSIWYENNPLVIQEAFAAGLPVIASNLGGMAEFVEHHGNGLLFQAGEARALAQAMQQFIEDPSLLVHLRTGLPSVPTVQAEAEILSDIFLEVRAHERA